MRRWIDIVDANRHQIVGEDSDSGRTTKGDAPPEAVEQFAANANRISGCYRFTRSSGVEGFFKTQRASTDAVTVLNLWEAAKHCRTAKIIDESDDHLIATFSTDDDDREDASAQFSRLCIEYGVTIEAMPSVD